MHGETLKFASRMSTLVTSLHSAHRVIFIDLQFM